jgi:hypothetical protein
MQEFETLGEAAIHAERAALRAFETAVKEGHPVQPDDRRPDPDDQHYAEVDAARAAWIAALERRWTLA